MEIVVQKAVELGVSSITPIITARCAVKVDAERMEKKRLQWQAIAIAACEQSGRNTVPIIHPIVHLDTYLECNFNFLKIALSPTGGEPWKTMNLTPRDIGLLIGPEGGLDKDELQKLTQHQFVFMQLGPRILRTETAAITALSILQAILGDL